MKFGKRLRVQIEDTLPEWRNKFLSYKELKKRLKTLAAPPVNGTHEAEPGSHPATNTTDPDSRTGNGANLGIQGEAVMKASEPEGKVNVVQAVPEEDSDDSLEDLGTGGVKLDGKVPARREEVRGAGASSRHISAEEQREFIRLLNGELEKFNEFFMEKEEDYVIKLECLKERMSCVSEPSRLLWGSACPPEVMALRRDIVGFHGEMVLLLNYSSLNFMGLLKILKKYDKRMLTNLRAPFIRTVSNQPFTTTDMLTKLIAQCEKKEVSEDSMSAAQSSDALCGEDEEEEEEEGEEEESDEMGKRKGHVNSIYRSTLAALKTLKDMKAGAGAGAGAELGNGNGSGLSSKGSEGLGGSKEEGLGGGGGKSEDGSGLGNQVGIEIG